MDLSNLRRPAERGVSDRPFAEVEASLEKAGRVEDLIRLYEGHARETSGAEAARVLVRAGQLAHERLRNPARSEELLRHALLLAEDPRPALLGLKAVHESRQDTSALVDVLERLGALSQGEEASAFFQQAATLHEQKLFRRDRAVLCLQRAVRAMPDRATFKRARQLLLVEERFQPIFQFLHPDPTTLGGGGWGGESAGFGGGWGGDPPGHAPARGAWGVLLQPEPGSARAEKVSQT